MKIFTVVLETNHAKILLQRKTIDSNKIEISLLFDQLFYFKKMIEYDFTYI